MEEWRHSFRPF